MTDDELAALLSLDALEANEQADAELQLGIFPAGLANASALLAEITATDPPADLRAVALDAATDRRAPGRPVDAATPCDPAVAFARTVVDFQTLLASLGDTDWDRVAHDEHGRIRDLVAHLVGIEQLAVRWLDPDDDVPEHLDHVESTLAVVEELAATDPVEVARRWYEAAVAVQSAAASGDPDRQVTFHDLTTSVPGFLTMRTFELWAHSIDITRAVGSPQPQLDDERMAILTSRLMAAVPRALAYRRSVIPGGTACFVLSGPAGGTFTVSLDPRTEPGEPDVLVVADTVDLCRVAARRLTPADLDAVFEGDAQLGLTVLAGLDAFARD